MNSFEAKRLADAKAGNSTAQFAEGRAAYRKLERLDWSDPTDADRDKSVLAKQRGAAKAKARLWLVRSARQGHPLAVSLLGSDYCDGKLFQRDVKRCLALKALAARYGDGTAASSLAEIYLNGYYGDRDLAKAIRWYQRSVTGAETEMYWRRRRAFRAAHLLTGAFGGKADLQQAFTWFLVAQKIGDAAAGDRAKALKAKLSAEQVRAAEAAAEKIAATAESPPKLQRIPKSELPSYL